MTSRRFALLVARDVVLRVCRFYIKCFLVFSWRLFSMQVKLISPLENRAQVTRFRVYGKSVTSMQTDEDGKRWMDRYALVFYLSFTFHFIVKLFDNSLVKFDNQP